MKCSESSIYGFQVEDRNGVTFEVNWVHNKGQGQQNWARAGSAGPDRPVDPGRKANKHCGLGKKTRKE